MILHQSMSSLISVLALKWHPDRNHGRELEASTKFQDISAAYEILVEPSTRAKYDNERAKVFTKYSPFTSPTATTNPYANFPPTRPPPATKPRPPKAAPGPNMKSPTSGAAQYAQYTANRSAWANTKEGAGTRADASRAYDAWTSMRGGTSQGRGTATQGRGAPQPSQAAPAVPPRRGPTRPQTFAHPSSNATPQSTPRARAGWTDPETNPGPGMARANTMRTPKKNGFDPGSNLGDEPPARSTSAYTNLARDDAFVSSKPADYTQPSKQYPQSQPRKPDPIRPDPFKGFRSPRSEENFTDRLRTPYSTGGGEKTYFSSDHLQRNPSTESASNLRSGWYDDGAQHRSPRSPSTPERHRSASPRMRASNVTHSSSSSGDSSSDDIARRTKLRPRGFNERRAYANKSAPESKTSEYPPQPSVTVENTDGHVFEYSKPIKRSTWNVEESNGSSQADRTAAEEASARRTSTGGIPEDISRHTSRDPNHPIPSPLHNSTSLNVNDQFEPLEKSPSWQEKFGFQKDAPAHRHFPPPADGGSRPKYNPLSFSPLTRLNGVGLKLKVNADLAAGSKRACAKSNFNAPPKRQAQQEIETEELSPLNWDKGCLFAMLDKADARPESSFFFANDSSGSASPTKDRSADKSENRFSTQDWHRRFCTDTANPFRPQRMGTEYARRGSPIKSRGHGALRTPHKSNVGVKRPGFVQPANVSVASSISDEDPGHTADSSASRSADSLSSGNAMDIDSKTPPAAAEMACANDPLIDIIRSQAAPPKAPGPDTDDHLNLNDFHKTAPFAPTTNGGLSDLGDLHSTLPFESKAASTLPNAEVHPHRLALPDPPKAPKPPNLHALKKADWDYYIVFVRKYMAEWNMFNQKMLSHFNARQYSVENGLPSHWLESKGETGYLKYMAWLQEDVRVRAHWDVSFEKHMEAMKTLGESRQVANAGKFVG